MPRVVFSEVEEFKNFVVHMAKKPDNFVAFETSDGELIVHQVVSTRPIFVAYIKPSPDKAKDLKSFLNAMGIRIFQCKDFEWDIEKPVGIKVAPT